MTDNPAARRLILHVGQTKAGSTSIQNYLESQADALLPHGFLFPRSVLLRQNPWDRERTPGHWLLIREGPTADFDAELAQHPDAAVILSIENLIADVPDTSLQRIHDYFAGWRIGMIAVLRPQYDWLRSRYVEEVLSGFRASTQTMGDFLAATFSRGAVSYDARLAHLAAILDADSVRAIPFHDAETPLVRRFLDEIGAPVTDPALADAIHANQREKSPVLIESKRRLNALTPAMSAPERLEVEHHLRQAARSLPPEAQNAALPPVILPDWQVQALTQGNAALVQAGILDAHLPLEDAGAVPAADHADLLEPATQALFVTGLRGAAGVAARTGEADRFAGTALSLTEPELDALMPWWSDGHVTVHLHDPGLARLFACAARRWSISLLPDDERLAAAALDHDGLATASPVTVLPSSLPDAAFWKQVRALGPVLLTAPAQDDKMLAVLIAALSPYRIVLTRSRLADPAPALPRGYRVRMIGRLILLEHDPAATTAQP